MSLNPRKNLERHIRSGKPLSSWQAKQINAILLELESEPEEEIAPAKQMFEANIDVGSITLRVRSIRVWHDLDRLTTRLYRRLHIIGTEEEQGDSGGRRWWNILARLLVGLIVLVMWGPVVAVVESAVIALEWRPIAWARREVASGFRRSVNAIGQALDNEVIRSKRRLYLPAGKAYRQLIGVTGFLLAAICMALEAQVEFAMTPAAHRPGWGGLYGGLGLVYLGLWGALVVDTWRQLATQGMRRAVAAAGRVLRVTVSVPVWPIKMDLDRAVRQDGFDPESPEGRLRRIAIVRRIMVWGTALNIACALFAPETAALLVFHPVLWAIYVFDAKRERRELVAG